MNTNDVHTPARRKHLLTDEELASHAGAGPDEITQGHRQGNGIRVHRTYIIAVSLVTLALVVLAIAMASVTM
ncbi:hypothetical protein [Nocardioides stalactiti]|uniref:hypothetical protein n=1 Tax=Nocardioides stalactiti TaxID=2755356 RepID=UPI0016026AA3|nr:hypothetical protein [Nocardioides stalactiti]